MRKSRKTLRALVVVSVVALLINPTDVLAANPKPGIACPQKGVTKIYAGKKYTCIKSGTKLVWDKGVALSPTQKPSSTPTATTTPTHSFPSTSASAITSPPSNLDGINSENRLFGSGLDPQMVTLGPKYSLHPERPYYKGQVGDVFEVPNGSPLIAPIDMKLISFNNRDAAYGVGADGTKNYPYNDLELCFQSESPEWPGLIFCDYHMLTSALLLGQNIDPACSQDPIWPGTFRAEGHLFYPHDDYIAPETPGSRACKGLIGRSLKRGELFGYAGRVGPHSMAAIRFKVPDKSVNPQVKIGDKYLHWVQPATFFYWKCYSPSATFPKGVLAYPFECGGYHVPTDQRSINFKYAAGK